MPRVNLKLSAFNYLQKFNVILAFLIPYGNRAVYVMPIIAVVVRFVGVKRRFAFAVIVEFGVCYRGVVIGNTDFGPIVLCTFVVYAC